MRPFEPSPAPAASVQPLIRGMRRWFYVDLVLLAIAGFQLYILTGNTDRFFAWTIGAPLSATFLGASYWGALPLVYLSAQQSTWARARLAVFSVWLFTVLTLLATLIHLDLFHLDDSDLIPRGAAWAWLIFYIAVPVTLLILTILQLRVPGGDPPRDEPLPSWMRLILSAQGAVMVLLGIVLFVSPLTLEWAWTLTPLTSRAVGSWLVGIGVISIQIAWENDWARVRPALIGLTVFAVLQLLALLRYSDTVDWDGPYGILYLLFLVSILAVNGYGWYESQRASTRRLQAA